MARDRDGRMRVTLPAMVAAAVLACAGGTHADEVPPGQAPAGELLCTVQGGFEAVVSANRVLNCRYDRLDARSELYTGYTGITGTGFGRAPDEALLFRVYAATPSDLAALGGNFRGSVTDSGTGKAGDLVGGQAGDILLRPEAVPGGDFAAASNYAPINAVAGFGYLHLIYNGVVPAHRHHHEAR